MNRMTISRLLLATCMTVATAAVSHAQGVQAAQLLSGGSSCLHVIRLVQIHGVNNSFNTMETQLTAHPNPFGAYAVPDVDLGDLEIVQIVQEPLADPACGPKFIVTIHNNSCRDVCNFHVTVVATLGRIFPGSPNSTVCVDKICAGANADICVQLPVECLAMGNHNGQMIGFQKLVVAIDSFDELAETNEANNLRALGCAEIPLVAVEVVEEVASAVETAEVNSGEVVETESISVQTGAPTTVVTESEEEAPVDALRSAIRMLDAPSQETTAAIETPQ